MDFLFTGLRFIGIIFLVLMVFNLMILVHEWGHFLAARWRGLKIEKFYIWFGKPLWKKTINGVEYGLGSIPAGGFVKLPQMAPMGAIEGSSTSDEPLPEIKPLDKIIVAFAGPLFSFLLAVAFAVIVWIVGKPEYEADSTRTLGWIKQDSPAARAGLLPGDEVISVDGKMVKSFGSGVDSIKWCIVASEGDKIEFKINRPGKGEMTISVVAEKPKVDESLGFFHRLFTRPPFRQVGIAPSFPLVVGDFMKDEQHTPAQIAGLQKGDRLVSLDGSRLYGPSQLSDLLESRMSQPVKMEVLRKGKTMEFTLTPRAPEQRPKDWKVEDAPLATLGILFDLSGERKDSHPGVLKQIRDAGRMISNTLRSITSSKSDLGASHLSGFLGIVNTYYNLFQDPVGWKLVLWFSVVLNINLAILNMLPFPVLDGGHIVMATLEGIRRRPLNLRMLEVVQTACVLLLFGFMIFISFKDAGDIFGMSQKPKDSKQSEEKAAAPVELKFLAPGTK